MGNRLIWTIFTIFSAATLMISGCITISTSASDTQDQSIQLTQNAIDQQLTQIAPGTAPDESSPSSSNGYIMGQQYTNNDGGFSFQSINGFNVEIMDGGFTVMSKPDANMSYGPLVTLNAEKGSSGDTLDQAFNNVKSNLSEPYPLNFAPAAAISVDGWSGLSADFSGVIEGQNVAGRVVYVNVGKTLEFLVMAVAPSDSWTNLDPAFQDVVNSVTFADLTPSEPLCGDGICGDFEHPGNCPQDCD